jgi:hypothetical protein
LFKSNANSLAKIDIFLDELDRLAKSNDEYNLESLDLSVLNHTLSKQQEDKFIGLITFLELAKRNLLLSELFSYDYKSVRVLLKKVQFLYLSYEYERVEKTLEIILNIVFKKKYWNLVSEVESLLDSLSIKSQLFLHLKAIKLYETNTEKFISFVNKLSLKDIECLVDLYSFSRDDCANLQFEFEKILVLNDLKDINAAEALELLVYFQTEDIIGFIKNKFDNRKIKEFVKVVKTFQEPLSKQTLYKINSTQDQEKMKPLPFSYEKTPEEKELILKLKFKDPLFDDYDENLVICFIQMRFYTLALSYIRSFPVDLKKLYLELELLFLMNKWVELIVRYTQTYEYHQNALPYMYLYKKAQKFLKQNGETDIEDE